MELKYSPKMAKTISEVDGGSYSSWSSSDQFPLLSEAKVGAGKLVLKPCGFALPHYADSSKIGYVLQGNGGTVGMIYPNTVEEKVLSLKKGDIIPVPIGVVSWWYNGGDSELAIIFLGETSKAHVPGEFSYFLLTGAQGILSSFSNEFIGRTYKMDKQEANKLAKSQTGFLIVKLEQGINMPQACKKITNKMVFSTDNATPDIGVKNGGWIATVTAAKFPLLEEVGLSCSLEKLDEYAISSPMCTVDSAAQLTYVVQGSGQIQIVGMNGELVLDTKVQAGHLIVVPKFFSVAKIADEEGLECFSIITSPRPLIEHFGGETSVWKALSPAVVHASFNVSPEVEELFMSNINETSVLIPPNIN